jgi:hypothetical protein
MSKLNRLETFDQMSLFLSFSYLRELCMRNVKIHKVEEKSIPDSPSIFKNANDPYLSLLTFIKGKISIRTVFRQLGNFMLKSMSDTYSSILIESSLHHWKNIM